MNEDKFIDVLTRGTTIPEPVEWTRLSEEYKVYYKNNRWQIPDTDWGAVVLDYVNKTTK
jgi:hypothetical protein